MVKKVKHCCFCGEIISGWGNNPWPANKEPDAECCDYCNATVVIPARIKQLQQQVDTEKSEKEQLKELDSELAKTLHWDTMGD